LNKKHLSEKINKKKRNEEEEEKEKMKKIKKKSFQCIPICRHLRKNLIF
jgi:hypothetical protein